MPINYVISLNLDLVYARWEGHVDFDQFVGNFQRYLKDDNYRAGRPELLDLSGITEMDINFSLVRTILRQVNDQSPEAKVQTLTVIYAPGETVFGMGRMYQTLAEMAGGIRVELFTQERPCLEALGLPYETFADLLNAGEFLQPQPSLQDE